MSQERAEKRRKLTLVIKLTRGSGRLARSQILETFCVVPEEGIYANQRDFEKRMVFFLR